MITRDYDLAGFPINRNASPNIVAWTQINVNDAIDGAVICSAKRRVETAILA